MYIYKYIPIQRQSTNYVDENVALIGKIKFNVSALKTKNFKHGKKKKETHKQKQITTCTKFKEYLFFFKNKKF